MQIEHQPLIPLSILKDLRCRHCERFVTCGPVQVLSDESMLCGRCQHYEKKILYRNLSYEALASMFIYPCYNWEKNCNRQLKWNQCLEHERDCAYSDWCSRFWRRGICCKGRRGIPYGDIRLVPVPERLLESIKCVQCENYLSCEPVYIQTNGKNVCHRCIYTNGPPPNSIRNYTYETLSSIVIFPCIFRNRGCPTRLKFGRDLWYHESECSYNQIYVKKPKNNRDSKERGVITTHSGHTYGTITPNSLLFAPPTPNYEFDMNKEILKSLKKHQERKVLSVDRIESQLAERYSEDGSEDLDQYRGGDDSRHAYSNRAYSPDGRVHQPQPSPRGLTPPLLQQQNLTPPIVQQQNQTPPIVQQQNLPRTHSPGAMPKPDYLSEDEENAKDEYFAGVLGLAYQPSFRNGVDRAESVRSNRELIQELKSKQKSLRDSSLGPESPYTKCNNLEEVIQVHDNIAK